MTTMKDLHDDALMDRLHQLVRAERQATAELLRVLIEVDRRLLFAQRGYPSLFAYCLDALNMSEPSIAVRIHAARCCRRFPRLLDMLHSGQLHLSAIVALAPHLRPESFEQLTAAACHKSKRQIQKLLADLNPKPDVPSSIRKLPTSGPQAAAVPEPTPAADVAVPSASRTDRSTQPRARQADNPSAGNDAPASQPEAGRGANEPAMASNATTAAPVASPPARPTPAEPLGAGRYKVQFTASEQLKDKIEQAFGLLRHRVPHGDMHGLIDSALDLLIREEHKRQHGATLRPRAKRQADNEAEASRHEPSKTEPTNPSAVQVGGQRTTPSRHIPNHVKREVYARDEGQCTFVSPAGRRCCEQGGLQYHHEVPFGKGGQSTTANVRLLCRVHNALLARHDYGQETLEACIERSRQSQQPAAARAPRSANDAPATAVSGGGGRLSDASSRPHPLQTRPPGAPEPLQPNPRLPLATPSHNCTRKPMRHAGSLGRDAPTRAQG